MSSANTLTVLVVDADPINLTAVAAVFHSAGYECLCARTGTAAEKAIATGEVELLVMDVGSEVDMAVGLLMSLKQMHKGDTLPTILLTESSQADRLKSAVVDDATFHLVKPFDPKTLLELAECNNWMPHLVAGHRRRGQRPTKPGWVSL